LNALPLEAWFFYPLAALAVVSAAGVVFARSPMYGALSLVCSFFFLAGIFVLLGARLVGILQIIVYAGAIMVLFLFVIMLLALSESDLGRRRITTFKIIGAAATLGVLVLATRTFKLDANGLGMTRQPLGVEFGTAAAVARSLFYEHLLEFEAISLLLLVAIVGAVVVAKRKI